MKNYTRSKVYIIAEAGVNHNGSLQRAEAMVLAAKAAGADAIKFQTFCAESVVSALAPKARYQQQNSGNDETQLEMLRSLELSPATHEVLIERCRDTGIDFISTPFDFKSIELLHNLGLEVIKIPSGEITNLPYLRAIGRLRKKVFLSTGMANLEEVRRALAVLESSGTAHADISVLHAVTSYPAPYSDVNLKAMRLLTETFNVEVGFSDHTPGIEIAIAAVALGARIIEKHFTMDRTLPGPDHRASLEPQELTSMVQCIRNVEQALGRAEKRIMPSEMENVTSVRKSIVAMTAISAGERFSEDNLAVKRPGTGISPVLWDSLIGRSARHAYDTDQLILQDELD